MNIHPENMPPPNFKELTEKEFAQSMFFSYYPKTTGYRQISPDALKEIGIESKHNGRDVILMVFMFTYQDGTGIALSSDYWAGKVRYFRFGECIHELQHFKNLGNCLNLLKCAKCDYTVQVDSSD